MIVLLLIAAQLAEAHRMLGFKPFSMNSDSEIKATPTSSYPPVLEVNERLSRKTRLEKHHGSEASMNLNISGKSMASQQHFNRFRQKNILPSMKFDVVEPKMENSVPSFQPLLGHSPGVGHDNPPGRRH